MHVLVVHNRYRQRGGEDVVVEHEIALLRQAGHEVTEYARHNDEITAAAPWQASLGALWNPRTVRDFDDVLVLRRPDVVHVHNAFPLVSPAIYWAASRAGVPVVQTLHNFRLVCPQGLLLRDGKPCEDCVGRLPWRGVQHGCYRGSRAQTAVAAASVVLHRGLGTWTHKVDCYIALSEFSRQRFVAGGLPAERIVVKPNSVGEPALGAAAEHQREGFLYAGRLAVEKGLETLVRAARGLPNAMIRVAGTGPLCASVVGEPALQALGYLDRLQLGEQMARSIALVMPGHCYENSPLAVLEAFAAGLPVIASRIGALAEVVQDGVTGMLVEPGDAQDLRSRLDWALAHPDRMTGMGKAARQQYLDRYTPGHNLRALTAIYRRVLPARAVARHGVADASAASGDPA
jgi:glycosyltransferase involved in cell wall biosynthesis